MNIDEANAALKTVNWTFLLEEADGASFAIKVNNEAVLATKVSSEDKEDADYDRTLAVVVEIGGQYFRKTGWAQVGSHCYGDYEPVWNGLEEVVPRQKTVFSYDVK